MADLSPRDCRNSLESVIRDSQQHTTELEELLAMEQSALRSQDTESLESVAARKLDCVSALDSLEGTRRDLAIRAGFGTDPDGMDDMLAWCDEDRTLEHSWRSLLESAGRCERQNRSNGAVSHVRAQQIRAALAILSGNPDSTHIYSPSGTATAGHDHREIARA